MEMGSDDILQALRRVGGRLDWPRPVDILLIGGAAGMMTGRLAPSRTTSDCDVIDFDPAEAMSAVGRASCAVAAQMRLPKDWLNDRAQQLHILPDGWRGRRELVGEFGKLRVFAVGRLDLLATKIYANRPQDREDIVAMAPTGDELAFVQTYLNMLRVPSRKANLDQIDAALKLVDALAEEAGDA